MPEQTMDQGSGGMSGSRMDHQAGGLVHNQNGIVFMDNLECNRFRLKA
jgi:hypothetical protein